MNKLKSILFIGALSGSLLACKKTEEPIIIGPPPSEGSSLTLEGKNASSVYANVVYVDFSSNTTKAVDRKSWNIAVSNGAVYKVFLNPSYQSTAVATNKFNLSEVTAQNPGTEVNLNHDIEDPTTIGLVDHWDGNLSKTAYAGEVPAEAAQSKVYLLSFEGNKEKEKWVKFKVIRTGEGYQVQYGRINDTQFKTIQVSKNNQFNMNFISFETDNVVQVEPEALKWDIAWAYSTNNSGLGSPYWVQDFVFSNSYAGVRIAEVTDNISTYADFGPIHLTGVSASQLRDAIGVKWRSTQPATGVKTDRFYVIQDPEGNFYKMKFVSMGVGGDGGERGRPVIEYKLVR